jgi:hypothetical protein
MFIYYDQLVLQSAAHHDEERLASSDSAYNHIYFSRIYVLLLMYQVEINTAYIYIYTYFVRNNNRSDRIISSSSKILGRCMIAVRSYMAWEKGGAKNEKGEALPFSLSGQAGLEMREGGNLAYQFSWYSLPRGVVFVLLGSPLLLLLLALLLRWRRARPSTGRSGRQGSPEERASERSAGSDELIPSPSLGFVGGPTCDANEMNREEEWWRPAATVNSPACQSLHLHPPSCS